MMRHRMGVQVCRRQDCINISGWGYSDDIWSMRWAYWNWETCTKHGLSNFEGAANNFRVKIVLDGWDIWPGNETDVHSQLPKLLMWLWMGERAIKALKGADFGTPGEYVIFEDEYWDQKMNDAFKNEAFFNTL